MKYEDLHCSSVDKIISFKGILACLLSGQGEANKEGFAINIESLIKPSPVCSHKFLFIASPTISDISISPSGRLWAVDLNGSIYYSKERLSHKTIPSEFVQFSEIPPSSCEWLSAHIPVCVIGEDNDLWIATYKGGLIHYDGFKFGLQAGVTAPIRFKEVAGRKYLIGCHSQILCLEDGYWVSVIMDNSIPEDTTISDLTMLDDILIAVTTNGLVLRQKEDKRLTLMYRSSDIFWHGCDVNKDVVYLAAGEKGAYKIEDKAIIRIDKNPTFSVYSTGDVVFFPRSCHLNHEFSYYNVLSKEWGFLEFTKKETVA